MINEICKVVRLGIKKQEGWTYFLDKDGDVSCMVGYKKNLKKVARCGVKRIKGYLYFIDNEGDVSSCKMHK